MRLGFWRRRVQGLGASGEGAGSEQPAGADAAPEVKTSAPAVPATGEPPPVDAVIAQPNLNAVTDEPPDDPTGPLSADRLDQALRRLRTTAPEPPGGQPVD